MSKISLSAASSVLKLSVGTAIVSCFMGIGSPVSAISLVNITAADFKPSAGLITFSEFPLDTINPSYTFADYGGSPNQPTVNFSGFFLGQSLSADPGVDCPGADSDGCVSGVPSSPLALDPSSPFTIISIDNAHATPPVLSGSPEFVGPISILFDRDLAGVGLDAGFFDVVGSTSIKVYDRFGVLLGQLANPGEGIQFLGLATSDGSEMIRGLEISLIGDEPAGFSIDNLRFGLKDEVVIPTSEVPGPLPLAGAGVALAMSRRIRRRIRLDRHG